MSVINTVSLGPNILQGAPSVKFKVYCVLGLIHIIQIIDTVFISKCKSLNYRV